MTRDLLIISRLKFSWWYVPERTEQSTDVGRVHPSQRGVFGLGRFAPRPLLINHLGFVQAADGPPIENLEMMYHSQDILRAPVKSESIQTGSFQIPLN